ncbi:MAG: hypothetical protein J6C28_06150 [Bacilli bacterium]|nr:hypothetical protein [Bacilli bacterium]
MKKKILIIVSIILVIILGISIYIVLYSNNQNNKVQERYKEIRESAAKAAEWHLKATQPYCVIGDTKEKKKYSHMNSNFFINNGYIKKEELLDVDGVSYCDIYVVDYRYIDESISFEAYGNDCEVNYKVYIKCKDYKDKGYIDWGN